MEYLPVLILLGIGVTVGVAASIVSSTLGPRVGNPIKDSAFECGVPAAAEARSRVSVRFYLVAILFLLFDVETIFFVPWALTFKKFIAFGPTGLWAMGLFFFILLVGFYYEWKKGALEWD